jgi:hypothetical protein
MAPEHNADPVQSMTLGQMRRNGVRSLAVQCHACHHQVVITADLWGDHISVLSIGPGMICSKCGAIGADASPNWQDYPVD